jgi:hypothetical protein
MLGMSSSIRQFIESCKFMHRSCQQCCPTIWRGIRSVVFVLPEGRRLYYMPKRLYVPCRLIPAQARVRTATRLLTSTTSSERETLACRLLLRRKRQIPTYRSKSCYTLFDFPAEHKHTSDWRSHGRITVGACYCL